MLIIGIRRLWKQFQTDSLFQNSFYLMLVTGVMAVFGFIFWLISARLASTEEIGLATTLISVTNMLAAFSLIGFDSAIVRFLSRSTQRNDKINTAIVLVGMMSFFLAVIFVLGIHIVLPKLSLILNNPFSIILFIVFCVTFALNSLTDSVFLAYRETKYKFFITTIFSAIRMLLPLAFAPWGAMGIFIAAVGGQSIGFILSLTVMIKKFNYRPEFVVNKDVLKQVWKYCFGNYIAGIFGLLPLTFLPVIITNHLGAKEAAYFYIVMMIGNLLYVIPQATTKSLFAEGSHNEQTFKANMQKSTRIIASFLIPSIAVLLLGGKYLLHFFGKDYSTGGLNFLYITAITGLVVSVYSVINSLFRVNNNLRALIIINIFYAGTAISFTYLLLPLGLVGIGIALFTGYLVASLIGWLLHFNAKKSYGKQIQGLA